MPTLSEYWANHETYTAKASDLARQFSFAGIAVVWVFRIGEQDRLVIPKDLLWPLCLFIIALACDLVQYVTGTIIWYVFCRHHEKRLEKPTDNPELTAPDWVNWPTTIFFMLKLLFVSVSYVLLLIHCVCRSGVCS